MSRAPARSPDVAASGRRALAGLLWVVIILSLIPAGILSARRIAAEGTERTLTILMDGEALIEQAALLGMDPFELALVYQAEGLNGIALYEQTPESLARSGRVVGMLAEQATAIAAIAGVDWPAGAPTSGTLVSEVEPGALDAMLAKNQPPPAVIDILGRTWYHFPGDSWSVRPAGPDLSEFDRYAAAGFDLAYRPRNFPNLSPVGEDFPGQANYLIHTGLELQGNPDGLEELIAASQAFVTGIIEGTDQAGMEDVVELIPTVRLLSFSQEHVNRGLDAEEIVPKYILAANERGIRIMYLRPWTEEHMGNMLENTLDMVRELRVALELEGYTIAPLDFTETTYRTSTLLRSLAAVGVVAGLLLLALLYPGAWGPIVAAGVIVVAAAAGGFHWDALALIAALVFPVIGLAYLRERLPSLFLATLISLVGAVLLAAVGSDFDTMMAISPFKGVAATLVLPPALYLFHYALRYRRPAQWVRDLAGQPLTVGLVALALVAAAAAGVILMRRGNFPIIGASEAELALRTWLADLFVRPRFKELAGHSLAVVGLLVPALPAWLRAGLLTAGVVAQATILNSFSHYHTPLLISLQRTLIALVLGLLAGLVLTALTRLAIRLGRNWLASADAPEPGAPGR